MAVYYNSANESPKYPHEPLMYPTRFMTSYTSQSPHTFNLYAYPSQRPPATLVQLQTQIPSIVEYVLGPTWRQHTDALGRLDVPQGNWTNQEETDVALRMLKVGGFLMDTSCAHGMWWYFDEGFAYWVNVQQRQEYIFGWPSEGGVWVLHLPAFEKKNLTFDEEIAEQWKDSERRRDDNRLVARYLDGSIDFANLTQSRTMNEFCSYMRAHGAVFFPEIVQSPEVHDAGLLDGELQVTREPVRYNPRYSERCAKYLRDEAYL